MEAAEAAKVRQWSVPRMSRGLCGAVVYGAKWCSDRCSSRAKSRAKDARRRGRKVVPFDTAAINPRSVYERDGWKCKLCGRAVDRKAVVPHPWAPTLDHIVPLSPSAGGGLHVLANVQLAHYACNTYKGVRAMNEQLRLVG